MSEHAAAHGVLMLGCDGLPLQHGGGGTLRGERL